MRRKSGIEHVSFTLEESKGPPREVPVQKTQIDEGVRLSPAEATYLLPHFTMIVVGKPGSGKTTVIRNLLTSKTFYKKKFDHVLLISPSANKMEIPIPKENMRQEFSLGWIEERLMEFNRKQTDRIIVRLRDLGIIDKFDVAKLNGQLFDELATDTSKRHGNGPKNIFEDKERFFTTGLFKQHMSGTANKLPGSRGKGVAVNGVSGKTLAHSLPQYVDEIHEKFVKKLTADDRNDLRRNTLIVLDDMVSDLKANEHNPLLTQLIFNRRHLMVCGTVSIIIVSQKYSMIPSRIRSNANWMILFKLNPMDAESVYKDAVDWPVDLWVKLLEFSFGGVERKSHNHLDLWIEQNKFFLNFKEISLSQVSQSEQAAQQKQQSQIQPEKDSRDSQQR